MWAEHAPNTLSPFGRRTPLGVLGSSLAIAQCFLRQDHLNTPPPGTNAGPAGRP